jgi:acetoin utilization protein AcuB
MLHKPTLKAAMSPFPYSIAIDAAVEEARHLMSQHNVRHLPVVDGQRLVGIVSDRDLRVLFCAANIADFKVRDVYVAEPYVVELDTPLECVLGEMADRQIGAALVTRNGKLAGIFTAVDACRSFETFLDEAFPSLGPDLRA